MNECLTTPQHEKQIGYWVSDKWQLEQCIVKLEVPLGVLNFEEKKRPDHHK